MRTGFRLRDGELGSIVHRIQLLFITSLLVLAMTGCGLSDKHVDDQLTWTEYDAVAASFPIADKPIFLYISQDNCHYCTDMEENIFTRPEIAWYLNENFRFVNINVDKHLPVSIGGKEYTYEKLWKFFNIEGLPTYFCFDENGRVNGILHGIQDVKTFKQFLKYVTSGQFGQTRWADWLLSDQGRVDTLFGYF